MGLESGLRLELRLGLGQGERGDALPVWRAVDERLEEGRMPAEGIEGLVLLAGVEECTAEPGCKTAPESAAFS